MEAEDPQLWPGSLAHEVKRSQLGVLTNSVGTTRCTSGNGYGRMRWDGWNGTEMNVKAGKCQQLSHDMNGRPFLATHALSMSMPKQEDNKRDGIMSTPHTWRWPRSSGLATGTLNRCGADEVNAVRCSTRRSSRRSTRTTASPEPSLCSHSPFRPSCTTRRVRC